MREAIIAVSMAVPCAQAQMAPPVPTKVTAADPGQTSIVADGTIQNVFAGKNQASPASGSLGFSHRSGSGGERFSAFLTVASAMDTLRGPTPRTFGRALLTPGAAGGTAGISSFAADYQRFYKYGEIHQGHGPRAYVSFSQTTWATDDAGATVANDVSIVSGGARYFWIPLNRVPDAAGNSISFAAELGVTFRSIVGEGADDVFLAATLGSKRSVFWGPEFVATIQVRQLSGFFALTVMSFGGGEAVSGLTGVQPVFGFSLDAPIITF